MPALIPDVLSHTPQIYPDASLLAVGTDSIEREPPAHPNVIKSTPRSRLRVPQPPANSCGPSFHTPGFFVALLRVMSTDMDVLP